MRKVWLIWWRDCETPDVCLTEKGAYNLIRHSIICDDALSPEQIAEAIKTLDESCAEDSTNYGVPYLCQVQEVGAFE